MNIETFLHSLHKKAAGQKTWLEQLKEESLPLVMWGCGDVGGTVLEYLTDNDIAVSCIWVDGANCKDKYKDLVIYDLPHIVQKYAKFNVILGHSCYEKGRELCAKYSNIQNVFYAFGIYGGAVCVSYTQIEKEASRFVKLCNHLADEASVKNLIAYLNTAMTGNAEYVLDIFKTGMNCYQNDVYVVGSDDVFLDIGAYNGDSIRLFFQATGGKYRKIISLEPDEENYLALSKYVAQNRLKNVVTSMLGAWNKNEDLCFSTGKEQSSGIYTEKQKDTAHIVTCYADRIDHIFDEEITLIKINLSNGVKEGIEGCEGIIKKYRPKLAVVVGYDIYTVLWLFEYLFTLNRNYKFYLRFNEGMPSTFTMYIN